MKVLVACLVDDHRDPGKGRSFEYHNLYLPLQQVAAEVVLFDFDRLMRERGREGMNRELAETVRRERPDVSLIVLFKDEFLPETLEEIRRVSRTVAYFFDDDWRRAYFAHWAPRFDFVTTPRRWTFERYQAAGLRNVLYSPFAFNAREYRRVDVPPRYDVSFVGGNHPWRGFVINRLRKAGIDVAVYGPYWPSGMLDQQAMVETFSASKINLNLSNSVQWDARYLLSSWRALRTTLRSPKDREQIKARHFEIPGAGGFQLSYYCEDLERHFVIGEEVAVYTGVDDLVDKIRFYLEHGDVRERVARAGYERAQRDHTMQQRLTSLLDAVTPR